MQFSCLYIVLFSYYQVLISTDWNFKKKYIHTPKTELHAHHKTMKSCRLQYD